MKLNGKNIITDKDITVTGANNPGDNLSDILKNQQTDIDKLKSNVKWLYKYGGVGSGGGGGTGSSKDWGIFATLGGRTITNGGTISLNGESTNIFPLVIAIKNGNGSYSVEISYDNGRTGRAVLSPDNGWRTTLSLNLTKNSFINITVSDGSDIKTIESNYITNPYSFSEIKLVRDSGEEYTNTNKDIFISDAISDGLNFKIHYEIAIEGEISYYWEYFNETTTKNYITNKSGDILLELPSKYLTNDNAGLYSVKCIISVIPTNQEANIIDKTTNFNLVPNTLYLKVSPEFGFLYDNIIEDEGVDVYSYKTSISIGLTLRAYYGRHDTGNTGIVNYALYDRNTDNNWEYISGGTVPITLNDNTKLLISFIKPGWKKISLECAIKGESYKVEKFIYLVETSTTYNWYVKSAEPTLTHYYRPGSDGISDSMKETFNNKIYYQMYNSSDPLKLAIEAPGTTEVGDLLLSIGIQYNEINNTKNPIISFNYSSESSEYSFCTVYQNKIEVENNTIPIFLGKTDITKFDVTKPENYHLIQILLRHTYRNSSINKDYRQICIYIDGTLEGASTNWITNTREISQVVLSQGNYSINLLEIANFSKYIERPIYDVDINYYYNTYKIKSRNDTSIVSEAETAIIQSLYNSDFEGNTSALYSIENQLLKLDSGTISSISSYVKVPTLVCRVERILSSYDNTGKTIFEWLNTSYSTEQDSNQEINVGLQGFRCPTTLRWYNPNASGVGSGIDFNDSDKIISGPLLFKNEDGSENNNIEFYLRLQGSSTMRFKSKNLTLGVRLTSEDDNAKIPVFSPNFKKSDTSTFLPDSAFTLKADVIDSSHSNNTSLGKFINDIYSVNKISGAILEGELINHVKTCLEGFPILLFLEVSDKSSGTAAKDTEYYYLGVYNFNLGRENQFNLGYISLEALKPVLDMEEPDKYSFLGLKIENSKYQPVEKLVVAEVQNNSPVWDFSQYHNSILFKIDSITGDTNYMFGDIVYGSEQITKYKTSISEFVKSVSGAGNFIFSSIGKKFESIVNTITGETISNIAYRTENTVPDADLQFARNDDGKTYSLIDRDKASELGLNLNPTRGDSNFGIGLLESCILKTESGETEIPPYLDYNSAIYYYTICMAFGMVDSVQKNLNIKTWNGKTFGLYFYDMDTALGTSNSGNDTSYFCFTDYWKTAITKLVDEDGNDVLDSSGKPVYNNKGASIYRDYYPDDKNLPSGYDIPSTFLFSIAKYAACFSGKINSTEKLDFPQNIWSRWRNKRGDNTDFSDNDNGILENSDRFITEYFEGHLKDIPEVLLNLNYRVKYLYNTTGTGFNDGDSKNLKGRQIEKVRDWLNSRFHLLDAYFNLGRETVLIGKDSDGNPVYEPLCENELLNTNPDIQILHDIFSQPTDPIPLNRAGVLKFRVKARNYTPLIHRHANDIERFLLEDENTEYEIAVSYNGNQVSKFGGSEGWTYLDSLNSFIQTLQSKNSFSLNTKRLEYIEGTEGTLTETARLNIPAARSLKLTSPEYSCIVNIDDSFYNLTKIDISGSKIQLLVNKSKLTQILANDISSEEINLSACDQLEEVSLTNSSIKKFTASPIWFNVKDSLELTAFNVTTLNLVGRGGDLIIKDSLTLNSLTFSNFKRIIVTSCPNLSEITCNDSSLPDNDNDNDDNKKVLLEEASITGCGKVSSIKLISNNLRLLDLSGCLSLSNLELRKLGALSENDLELGNLETLRLANTKISKISRTIKKNNEWIECRNDNILYITDYPNLVDFSINGNKSVEYIKFKNQEGSPFKITNSFSECSNLKRIFGHIEISTDNCFNNCELFSIHGYYLESNEDGKKDILLTLGEEQTIKYNGISIIDSDGIVKHPLDMGDSVVEEITEGDNKGKHRMVFQEGDDVTNITFSNTTNLNSTFSGTSCTIFDIYYIFQNLEKTNSEISASSCFYNTMGKKGSGVLFNWDENVDNSPNRYMFKDWGWKLTSLSSALRGRIADRIRIYSTEVEENGGTTTVKDDGGGLFYYLPNITTINAIFYGGVYYTDNKVFRGSSNGLTDSGYFSKLKDISYFSPKNLIDNINTLKYTDIFTTDGSFNTNFIKSNLGEMKLGNLENLLVDCTALTKLHHVMISCEFINFDKAKICFPKTLKSIVLSFLPTRAIGKLDFPGMLSDLPGNKSSELEEICQSFYVRNSFEDWINNITGGLIEHNFKDAYIELSNSMFNKFQNLTNIGFKTGIDASGAMLTSDYSSFGGKLKKYLSEEDEGKFPFGIISGLPKLRVFTGFFRNCDTGIYSDLSLPGSLFEKNTELENISRCFQDIRAQIKLTPNSFENCTKLGDVSYLFSNSLLSNGSSKNLWENGNKIGIVSSIPYKFFYHGSDPTETSITTFGSNETKEIDITGVDGYIVDVNNKTATQTLSIENGTKTIMYENILDFKKDSDDNISGFILSPVSTETETIYDLNGSIISNNTKQIGAADIIKDDTIKGIRKVNSTIRNMQNCFQGQGWILPYEVNVNDINESKDLEPNIYYQPFNYLYNNTTSKWVDKTSTRDDKKLTCMWIYDGRSENILDKWHYIDEDIDFSATENSEITPPEGGGIPNFKERCITNFFCPPDLLRYCTEDADITELFNYAGYTEQLYLVNNIENTEVNLLRYVKFGITGRICPYLLKPVSRTTSLKGFLTFAPRLSYYKQKSIEEGKEGDIYLIPKTFFSYATKINNLSSAFKGCNLPNGCRLDVFDKLTTSINVDKTFQYSYFHGTNNKKFNLSNVFINNKISSAIATFSIEDCPVPSLPPIPSRSINQYINFGLNFKPEKLPIETDALNYKVKHVYDGYSENTVTFEGYEYNSSENKSSSKEFRIQNGKDEAPYNYRTSKY